MDAPSRSLAAVPLSVDGGSLPLPAVALSVAGTAGSIRPTSSVMSAMFRWITRASGPGLMNRPGSTNASPRISRSRSMRAERNGLTRASCARKTARSCSETKRRPGEGMAACTARPQPGSNIGSFQGFARVAVAVAAGACTVVALMGLIKLTRGPGGPS
jgi:hypothetical protein